MRRLALAASAGLAIALLASACAPAQESFLAVQVCLEDAQGVARFKSVLREVAASEGLRYIDGSDSSAASLSAVGADEVPRPFIHVGVEGERGFGLTATNLGLTGTEAAIGFTRGRRPADEADQFAAGVVRRLKAHWRVERVPQGRGAFPMTNCPSGQP